MSFYNLLDTMISKLNKSIKIEEQSLNTSERAQARANINAASKNDVTKHNLLDNSYFVSPVNQRRFAGGTISSGNYPIDRWFCLDHAGDGETINVSFTDSGLYIKAVNKAALAQHFPNISNYYGKKVTVAIGMGDGTVYAKSDDVPTSEWGSTIDLNNEELNVWLQHWHSNQGTVHIRAKKDVTISWIALYEGEYTAETLPDYRPKGYTAELAECQRYYYRLQSEQTPAIYGLWTANVADYAQIMITVPQRFRVNPTVVVSDNVVIAYYTQTSSSPSASGTHFISMAGNVIWLRCNVSGLKSTDSGYLAGISTSAYIEFIADL